MNWRSLGVLSLGMGLSAGSFGCGAAEAGAAAGASAGAAAGGAAGQASVNVAGSSNLGGSGGAGGAPSACAEQTPPQRTQGALLSLSLQLVMSGKPFAFGQSNTLADGGSLVPLNFRFYISEVQLLRSAGGEPVAVDVVTASGAPEPYGVHLFNADDDASRTVRVLAPAGDYTGLRFALGLKLACNQQPPASLSDPLTDNSQMTWPHTGGFLFLRYEGRYTAADGSANAPSGIPPVVHMGGSIEKEFVPRVTVPGAFSIPTSGGLEKRLSVAMDEIFKGATANIDVSDVAAGPLSGPDSVAGERLRRSLPDVNVFVLEP